MISKLRSNAALKKIVYPIFISITIPVLFLLFFETGLRLRGLPKGTFWGWFPGKDGLYPENATIEMLWSPFPYTVQTNSLGFRGSEFTVSKPHNTLRIVAIGDSITDGFFVDNNATYPYFLQDILQSTYKWPVEVINAAHGGGSIDKELAILQRNVLPLHPDIVILTFVTNDIADIWGKSREDLVKEVNTPEHQQTTIQQYLLTRTAIGEFVYETYLTLKSPLYSQAKERLTYQTDRYIIPGGDDYLQNAEVFTRRFKEADGLVLYEPFPKKVKTLIENYLFALEVMKAVCVEQNIEIVFVYFPAYPQIYDPGASLAIQEVLAEACLQLSIHFLDATDTFRKRGQQEILHLAPIDFHLNPAGNKVLALAIAEYISSHFSLEEYVYPSDK